MSYFSIGIQVGAVAEAAATQPVVATSDFKVGADTLSTVVSRLGKPATVVHNSDGTTMAIYASNRTQVKGATFIPIVGLLAGGAKAHVTTRTFTFGGDGLLKSYSTSDTSLDCSSGVVGVNCR